MLPKTERKNHRFSDKTVIRKSRVTRSKLVLTCAILIFATASNSFADVIGDWETGLDGWGKWDSGTNSVVANSAMDTNSTYGVTLHSQSLKVVQSGFGAVLALNLNNDQRVDLADNNTIEIDFTVPPGTGGGRWIVEDGSGYGVILNAEKLGWTKISTTQYYFDSYDGSPSRTMHLSYRYDKSVFGGVAPTYAQIIFTLNGYNGVSDFYFDNATIGSPPATNPSPADAATGVDLTPTLSWTAGADADSHNVYFGTDSPPAFIQNQTETTYIPGTLATGTTYYWRIDEVNDTDGTATGDVWHFTTPGLIIKKCTVKAGKTQGADGGDVNNIKDSLVISGTADFPADANRTTQLDINIISAADGNIIYPETINDFNSHLDSKGKKIGYSYKIPKHHIGAITSLKMDFVKSTFSLTAKNIDLTGLDSPVKIEFVMGNTTVTGEANEVIVNGKKLIPTRLMRMYDDKIVVTKATAKHKSTKALSDSLTVTGEIAVEDINNTDMNEPNLAVMDVNFIWGDQTFAVGDGNFVAAKTGHKYTCKKVQSDANEGVVTAKFDLDKCTFTVSIKDANNLNVLPDSPDVNFSINYGIGDANDFNETADVNLVTRRSY